MFKSTSFIENATIIFCSPAENNTRIHRWASTNRNQITKQQQRRKYLIDPDDSAQITKTEKKHYIPQITDRSIIKGQTSLPRKLNLYMSNWTYQSKSGSSSSLFRQFLSDFYFFYCHFPPQDFHSVDQQWRAKKKIGQTWRNKHWALGIAERGDQKNSRKKKSDLNWTQRPNSLSRIQIQSRTLHSRLFFFRVPPSTLRWTHVEGNMNEVERVVPQMRGGCNLFILSFQRFNQTYYVLLMTMTVI